MKTPALPFAISLVTLALMNAASASAATPPWADARATPDMRAQSVVKDMTLEEQLQRVHSEMAMPILGFSVPAGALGSAGYIPADSKHGIPALQVTDASLGVGNPNNVRPGDGGTPLPSGLSIAATWNPRTARQAGSMIGHEAWSKGFNVLLAGGVNLARDPRNGRNFEYFGEDPLLAGTTAGETINGVQAEHVLSTVKHFALNDQETARMGLSANIGEQALRESDLLAFQLAIEKGQPGAVMCGYNRVNGVYNCENKLLLQDILKDQWGYRGFVMSDWGAVHSPEAALRGLDIEMGTQIDKLVYGSIPFQVPLAQKAAADIAYRTRVADMNTRILRSVFAAGLVEHPPIKTPIDYTLSREVAHKVALEGSVLLRNEHQALPLSTSAQRILVIGGHADVGVLSGGGSAQVIEPEGPALSIPQGGEGLLASTRAQVWHRSSPLQALKAALPKSAITFNDGRSPGEAAELARHADVVIVFATQWMMESYDTYDLNLPQGQNELIDAVASANPHTVVVLETGGAVAMPWLNKTAAVLEAWYAGASGGQAIADLLTGRHAPSGRLPVTFPATLEQLPRPAIASFGAKDTERLDVNYDIEGADVGYRWFARTHAKPLFPFGYGLTYTQFAYSNVKVTSSAPLRVTATVTNTGKVTGRDVPQLYLTHVPGRPQQRLLGWSSVSLKPGESQQVSVEVDDRLLADFDANQHQWNVRAGDYQVALGRSATDMEASLTLHRQANRFADRPVTQSLP